MSASPPAVLFDLDGTLLELDVDIEAVRLALAALFAPHGVTGPFRPILGKLREAAAEAGRRGADGPALHRQGLGLIDDAELVGARVARARPDALATVRALVAAEVPLAIVTDNGRAAAPVALAAAGFDPAWFRPIVTRDDVAETKPHPEGVRAAAAALPVPPTWFVGDNVRDVEAARAAALPGLRVLAVPAGALARPEAFTRAGADRVGTLAELVALVLG